MSNADPVPAAVMDISSVYYAAFYYYSLPLLRHLILLCFCSSELGHKFVYCAIACN